MIIRAQKRFKYKKRKIEIEKLTFHYVALDSR